MKIFYQIMFLKSCCLYELYLKHFFGGGMQLFLALDALSCISPLLFITAEHFFIFTIHTNT